METRLSRTKYAVTDDGLGVVSVGLGLVYWYTAVMIKHRLRRKVQGRRGRYGRYGFGRTTF